MKIKSLGTNVIDSKASIDRNLIILKEKQDLFLKDNRLKQGVFLKMPDGEYLRITHYFGDGVQTAKEFEGSYYLGEGTMSYSGSLDPIIKTENIRPTNETKIGHCWFFADRHSGGAKGIQCEILCPVFELIESE